MQFRPEDIPLFSVIRVPYHFEGTNVRKLFVVISHFSGYVYCLKTTSRTESFDGNPDRLKGVVAYDKGECALFTKRTIIDPTNQFPIAHTVLRQYETAGDFECYGTLPADFKAKLTEAIKNSRVIEHRKKKRLLGQLQA